MPNKEFLETYPLYKKFETNLSFTPQYTHTLHPAGRLPKPPINMYCATCSSEQTFNMNNEYYNPSIPQSKNTPIHGQVREVRYTCSACSIEQYIFLVHFGFKPGVPEKETHIYFEKVGQFPAWSIKMEKELEKELGDHAELYKKGLINESQGYGIGAFAYFRRITETVIDQLLDSITDLLEGEEKEKYETALAETKKTTVTQDKIDLVKELLPVSLRPNGMNPLSLLHAALSEGLHAGTDDECLEYAGEIKQVLIYLVNQVERSRSTSKSYTESMKKILDKRSGRLQKGTESGDVE